MAEQAKIVVQVQPSASQNKLVRFENGVLHLKIAAPPVKGKANQELVKFLSDTLDVSKTSLTIEKGLTSRRKVIAVQGLAQEEVMKRLGNKLDF